MSDERAEQWLAVMAESGRWTPTGIEMLREKIERYGLAWVIENEPKIRRFGARVSLEVPRVCESAALRVSEQRARQRNDESRRSLRTCTAPA